MNHAPAHDDRRQPAQARLARRARARCGRRGSSTATRSREGKHDAVRLALRRPGARRHRHRHRRRADAAPFRHDVHRGPRRRRLRAQEDGAHPQSLRRRRAGGRRAGRAPPSDLSSTTPRSCARRPTRQVKYTLPGPMTMVDTLYDAHYGSREKLAWAFAEILNEEARAIAAAGVDVDPVRRAGVQRLLRRGARLGRRGAGARRRGPRTARRPSTSATATASRPTSTGRRRSAANGGSTSRRFRCSPRRRSTRCRSNARIRTCRSTSSRLLGGKDVLVGAIDVATDRVETPEDVAAVIRAGAARSSRRTGCYPCTNCGMVPLARDVARGKLAALGRRRGAGPARSSRRDQ